MQRLRCFNTLPRALVLSALAIFYNGCAVAQSERSQAPAQASAAAEIDPCALVSKKDAAAILGQAVRDARREDIYGRIICRYEVDVFGPDYGVLKVIIKRDDQTSVDTFKQRASMLNAKTVDDIGDYAFVVRSEAGDVLSIFVLKGNAEIELEIVGASKRVSTEELMSVARKVASKI